MAKPTGFMEYKKVPTKYLSPLERIKNFDEFLCKTDEKDRQIQAARCMDWHQGVP
jgi:glutamate synthase (NADPH/NADH) small chain